MGLLIVVNLNTFLINTFDQLFQSGRKVCDNRKKQSLDSKIRKTSYKILVSEEKLYKKRREGKDLFKAYCNKKLEKYGLVLEAARLGYKQITQLYEDNENKLIPRVSKDSLVINKELLMKTVRRACLKLSQNPDRSDVAFFVKLKEENQENWSVLAGYDDAGYLQLVKWSGRVKIGQLDPDFLGQGSFARVQAVYHINKADFAAIKCSCPKDLVNGQMARDDVKSEFVKLGEVNSKSVNAGLQPPARKLFYIKNNGAKEVGLLQDLFSHGDMLTAVSMGGFDQLTQKEWIQIAIDLFKGIAKLHETMVHGDIKPNNCFVCHDDGQWKVVLGDFGGAKNIDKEFFMGNFQLPNNKGDVSLGTTVTPGFFTFSDNQTAKFYREGLDQENWVKTHKKRDIYAMATTLWFAITKQFPYLMHHRFPKTHQLFGKSIVEEKLGPACTRQLMSCLSEKPEERPEADTIIKMFSELRDVL